MQAVINKLTEQSEGYNDQLAVMTHALVSVQLTQRMKHSPRHSSSLFASPRQLWVDFPLFLEWKKKTLCN